LLKEIQKRAVELEIAKSEIDILYRLSSHLIESSTPQAVLDGISVYARDNGATSGYLYYVDENDNRWMELVAEWALIEAQRLEIGFRLPIPDHSIRERWQSEPDLPTLIADVTTTEVISSDNQDMIQRFGVRALSPCHYTAKDGGLVLFTFAGIVRMSLMSVMSVSLPPFSVRRHPSLIPFDYSISRVNAPLNWSKRTRNSISCITPARLLTRPPATTKLWMPSPILTEKPTS
jgi:hypothetical protein